MVAKNIVIMLIRSEIPQTKRIENEHHIDENNEGFSKPAYKLNIIIIQCILIIQCNIYVYKMMIF